MFSILVEKEEYLHQFELRHQFPGQVGKINSWMIQPSLLSTDKYRILNGVKKITNLYVKTKAV